MMIRRCLNTSFKRYDEWGGRGITVCEHWQGKNGFYNFIADMGEKPSPTHTLDRIDNNLGYSGENCRWATAKEQIHNRQKPVQMLTFSGCTKPISDWADEVGVSYEAFRQRILRGKTMTEALAMPLKTSSRKEG
jgi:hypothetical protein